LSLIILKDFPLIFWSGWL